MIWGGLPPLTPPLGTLGDPDTGVRTTRTVPGAPLDPFLIDFVDVQSDIKNKDGINPDHNKQRISRPRKPPIPKMISKW